MGVGQSMETLLSVENLGVNYGSVQALHNATFRLGAGSICGLIGMNGSGKSTLFKAIMGVTPAHTGSVEIAGGDPAAARKSGVVSYVPQSEEIDWSFPVSVRDVVAMGRYRTLGPTRRLHSKDKQALAHALERLELTDLAARQIGALSGGQRKRAFVARAIAQGARLLLLENAMSIASERLSTPANGSSSSSSRAPWAIARATKARLRCPPDSAPICRAARSVSSRRSNA